ncbi:MAG TPA: cobalt ECF transporter T component CbiQ [Thermodesulfobacteriota bacterium]|nr:cobalt ECF transporter T component CbiQ [Thermodesulfobacteriota bacterium]
MFDLFSDIFAFRDHPWTRVDPRVKLVVALAAISCLLLSTRVPLPLLFLAVSLAGMAALRTPVRLVLLRLMIPLGMAAVLVVIQAFTVGQTELFDFSIWGKSIPVLREGLLQGLFLASRVIAAVSILLLFSLVTPAHTVFSALRWFRVPAGWVEIAMLMYRYTFALLDRASDVAAAQKVRLGYSGLTRSVSSVGRLAGIVLIHSYDQANRTHEAMLLRGYRNFIPTAPLAAIPANELRYAVLACAAMGVLTLLLETRAVG